MKTTVIFLLYIMLAGLSFSQEPAEARKILFNGGWKFAMGQLVNAEQPEFDDSKWRPLDLPHDFSIEGSFKSVLPSCAGYLPGGTGWYRKTFLVAPEDSAKKLFVYFDGVYKNSEVWINGRYLGKHPSGYTAFEYEISKWLIAGKPNVIAVKVDREDITDSGWYTGSGIYRNVFLKFTGQVHLQPWGVFVTTPEVSTTRALVEIRIALINEAGSSKTIIVETTLLDPDGNKISSSLLNTAVSNSSEKVVYVQLEVAKPFLWSNNNPYLYTLKTIIRSDGGIMDQQTTKVGIRTIRFDAEKGFFLNGMNMKMKGVCLVHDAGAFGSAVPRKVWEDRLDILRRMGCNAIRACHNPHAEEFLDVCDEKGFLVIAEAYDEWEQPKTKWIDGWNQTRKVQNGYYKYFPEWGKRDLKDQLLRDRNHPSIVLWSIGNEIDFPNDPYSHPSLDSSANPQTFARYIPGNPRAERLAVIAKDLVSVVKAFDTTRPITAGLASAFMSHQVGFAQQIDVLGYNYQEYLFTANHEKYPGKAFYASETGHRLAYWDAVEKNDFVMGQFLWTGFEYLGESFKWPQRTNRFGIIDLAGYFKAEAYFRQSLWSDTPMAYIGAWDTTVVEPTIYYLWDHKNALPHWNWQPGKIIRISGFTNCEEMELFLNGKSLGRKQMTAAEGRTLNWYIPYEKGQLKAVASIRGKPAATFVLNTSTEPHKLVTNSDAVNLKAGPAGIARIEMEIQDKNGVLVYAAQNLGTIKVGGPARIMAIENANPTDTSDYKSTAHTAYRGRLTVYVQSTGNQGKAVVNFSSPGLKSSRVKINIKK